MEKHRAEGNARLASKSPTSTTYQPRGDERKEHEHVRSTTTILPGGSLLSVPEADAAKRRLNGVQHIENAGATHSRLVGELQSARRLPRFLHRLPVKQQYFRHILAGRKAVEGRIHVGIASRIRDGDAMMFTSGYGNTDACLVKVLEKRTYDTFRQMLADCGVLNCLPDFNGGIDAAEQLYRSFPGYAAKEQQHGVCAIFFRLFAEEELLELLDKRVDESTNGYRSHYGPTRAGRYDRDGARARDWNGDRHAGTKRARESDSDVRFHELSHKRKDPQADRSGPSRLDRPLSAGRERDSTRRHERSRSRDRDSRRQTQSRHDADDADWKRASKKTRSGD